MHPDPLAGLNRRERYEKELADGLCVISGGGALTASRESLERDRDAWAGLGDTIKANDLRPIEKGERVEFVVCARHDLDHPLYLPDNLFTDCADCGCNMQYRPDIPSAPRICICCAAVRVRKHKSRK